MNFFDVACIMLRENMNIIWEEFCICNTRYTSTKTQTRFKKTYLFMIYERFRIYSHLPHQVANNGINCYDTKLSKYQNIQHSPPKYSKETFKKLLKLQLEVIFFIEENYTVKLME